MNQYRLLTLFADGGFMMYPLVLCSMIALGVIIAKAITLQIAHRGTASVLHDVEELAMSGDLDGAVQVARETPGPAAAIAAWSSWRRSPTWRHSWASSARWPE